MVTQTQIHQHKFLTRLFVILVTLNVGGTSSGRRMTYYRQFNGLDDANEVQKVQFVERSGQLWQGRAKSEASRTGSEGYFTVNLNGECTQPMDVESDIRQISWATKTHQIFHSTDPQDAYSQTAVAMSKAKETHLPHRQQHPKARTLAVETQKSQTTKEAELESAVKILQSKLEYTERKIMESENNKDLLKARLDELIQQLTTAGFDPNMRPAKLGSLQMAPHSPKEEDTKVHATQCSELKQHSKAVPNPFRTQRPAKVSDELWEKLLTLASEYERRLNIVKSLEDKEKLIKEQLTSSHNPPEAMGRPEEDSPGRHKE